MYLDKELEIDIVGFRRSTLRLLALTSGYQIICLGVKIRSEPLLLLCLCPSRRNY